jgi:hypothetical protein
VTVDRDLVVADARNRAFFAGGEYQITQRIAVDFSGQRLGLAGGNPDRQLLVGLTMNVGKVQKIRTDHESRWTVPGEKAGTQIAIYSAPSGVL